MLHGHGDDTYKYDEIRINFSSNIYNHFDHTSLFKHLTRRMHDVRSYPEPTPSTLERQIALFCNIPANCVMATNGATEAIYLIAQTFRDAHSTILQPTFAEYADACSMHSHRITAQPHNHITAQPHDLIWLCNPNNPTGEVTPKAVIIEALHSNPDTFFILDASYAAYTTEPLISPAEGIQYPNLIMLHSMTKDYGIPGLRLGYITCHADTLTKIATNRMPWSVSQMAIDAGLYLLQHSHAFQIDAYTLNRERKRIATELQNIGIHVYPSQSNILLCRHPWIESATLKERLATEHGILIRDASNFHGLDTHHFRIAVQTPEENDILLNILTHTTV